MAEPKKTRVTITREICLRKAANIVVGIDSLAEGTMVRLDHWNQAMQTAQVLATIGAAMRPDEVFEFYVEGNSNL